MVSLIGFPALRFQSDPSGCGIEDSFGLRGEDDWEAGRSEYLADLSVSPVDEVLLPPELVVVVVLLGRDLAGLGTIGQPVEVVHHELYKFLVLL